MLERDIEKVLVSAEEIKEIAIRLGKVLTADYKDKFPLVIGLLKGCVPFMGELITKMDIQMQVGFMDVSSYHGGIASSGDVKIEKDLGIAVGGWTDMIKGWEIKEYQVIGAIEFPVYPIRTVIIFSSIIFRR